MPLTRADANIRWSAAVPKYRSAARPTLSAPADDRGATQYMQAFWPSWNPATYPGTLEELRPYLRPADSSYVLTPEEFDERSGRALQARTGAELAGRRQEVRRQQQELEVRVAGLAERRRVLGERQAEVERRLQGHAEERAS